MKVLLTGERGTGKTTLIKRLVEGFEHRAGGIITEPIFEEGAMVGLRMRNLTSESAVFAHVDFQSSRRIDGRYGVWRKALRLRAIPDVRRALRAYRVVVIDEIGCEQLRDPRFRDTVLDAFASDRIVLATLSTDATSFIETLRTLADVMIVNVTSADLDRLYSELCVQLRNLITD
jgi:nucleoside-triphosphatase